MESQRVKTNAQICSEMLRVSRQSYQTNKELKEVCQKIYAQKTVSGDRELRNLLLETIQGCDAEMAQDMRIGKRKAEEVKDARKEYKIAKEREHNEYKESVGW